MRPQGGEWTGFQADGRIRCGKVAVHAAAGAPPTMSRRLGVVMDPIERINPKKDTTLALLLAAAARGFKLHYIEMRDLTLRDGRAAARMRPRTGSSSADRPRPCAP
jgi:hypothetical protein